MKSFNVVIFLSLLLMFSLTPIMAKGGPVPCLASCCLDPRLGYEMNEGKDIHMYDWLQLAGRVVGVPLWILPAYEWGYKESGIEGCCVSVIWGPRSGRDFKSLKLRSKEIMMCIPIIDIYPLIAIPLEAYGGKTWSEVVEQENLKR